LQSVVDFIKLNGKQDGEAYTTRVIRTLTRNELCDEEKGAVDLPLNTTKRELYEKHCFDRGWAIKSDNMGRYLKVKNSVSHQEDDIFWPSGAVPIEVCSWFSFTDIWKTHCSNIRIRRPWNDTCGKCTVFRNAFSYHKMRKKTDQRSMDELEEDDDDLPELSDLVAVEDTTSAAPLFKDDDVVGEMAKSFLGDDCIEQEKILEATVNHVLQANGMRHFVQHATESKVHCRCEEVPHKDREYVIVCDYVQNMPLPHYGGEQPWDIYYFSPLTINLFGIVDLSITPNKLNCYAYREFTAKKGSNNVASLLMQDLFDKFWLRKGKPGKKLTVAMDNCGGQNNNNVVLRLAPYLVEMGYFKTVVFAFYVRGHTKNTCDRKFNQMKLKYHKKMFSPGRKLLKRSTPRTT
jgi:hypothetical protein